MLTTDKEKILLKARTFFRETILTNHINGLKKLTTLSSFNFNPFLIKYLANFLNNNNSPESLAKALLYPRVTGTSINTIFGNQAQIFCKEILEGVASVTPGLDIEFIDQVDQRRKYCQIKAGPQTINKDDVKTISDHFEGIKRLARTNRLDLRIDDMVVGVLYGTPEELSGNYLKIKENYPVYTGQEFWSRLTGDDNFYFDLIHAFGEEAKTVNGKDELEKTIAALANDIRANFPELSL